MQPQRNRRRPLALTVAAVIVVGFFGSTLADTLRPFAAVLLGFLAVTVLYGLAKWRFWR